MAPALAATTVARAGANALTLSIATEDAGTGTFTAVHDGTGLTTQGEAKPPISVLTQQDLLDVGTLVQEAEASVGPRGAGHSAACAGVAGDGATVAEVGESRCLSGGDNVGVTFANLDLSGVAVVNPDSALEPLRAVLGPLEETVIGPLTSQLSAALSQNLGPLSDLRIGGTIGAIEARCTASPGTASGSAHITDARIGITLAGRNVETLNIPVTPAPNTKVVTDLDSVVNAVLTGLEVDLTSTLDGQLAGLTAVTQQIRQNIVDTIIDQVSAQLKPLEENVLDITVNKQTAPAAGQVQVTAVDARVLPAAAAQIGAPLVSAQVANVDCGPNGRYTAPDEDDGDSPGNGNGGGSDHEPAAQGDLPDVQTVIDAGQPATTPYAVSVALMLAGALGLGGLLALRTHG